ncbi:MAG: VOC family protein [Segniliparus sp.]|uniref:VOC family protein n=1 Tax=Segniliparus sp. TaxID=2804064 RepID=UPI003F33514F
MSTITQNGVPVWVDFATPDFDSSAGFFAGLFGWTYERNPDFGGYGNFSGPGGLVAGGMELPPEQGVPPCWTVYFQADDAAATTEQAKAAGATAFCEPTPVGDLGVMAVIADPEGAAFGLWQPGTHKGFVRTGKPGAPVWFELNTRDKAAGVDFYTGLLGWSARPYENEGPDYTVFGAAGGDELGGAIDGSAFLPEGVPNHWQVYFGVADTDAAVEKAQSLGGSVLAPAFDTPNGKIAILADPKGIAFGVVSVS